MQNNNKNLHPFIFTKKVNVQYKLVPFNLTLNDVGRTKYLPPVSKEWKNSVYNYNYYNNINFPIYDLNINSLIKGYFSLYFNHKFLEHKYISRKKKLRAYKKIFVSKAEVKHTNNKAIVTIYVFNKEKQSLLSQIRKLRKILILFPLFWQKLLKTSNVSSLTSNELTSVSPFNIKDIFVQLQNYTVNDSLRKINNRLYFRILRFIKKTTKILSIIRRLRLRLSLNKYKFEDKFLFKLSNLISQYYGKKVEFNIVNLKSLANNTDIFTEVLTLKLKKEKSNPMWRINSLLARVVLPKSNSIIERGRIEKQVDHELIDNKYKNLNISNIMNNKSVGLSKDNLNKLLYNLYYGVSSIENSSKNEDKGLLDSNESSKAYYLKLRDIIFNNIKYKNMGGARLTVKGRLTRRYRADRALYKFKWKGGLKNIDSAFKGLSTVVFRGYLDSNVEKATFASRRRIGSFGVKSWFSGK